MRRYAVKFYIFPYDGVKREPSKFNDGNQSISSPEVHIAASDFREAFELAKAMLVAIKFDGRVWECGISKIEETSQ